MRLSDLIQQILFACLYYVGLVVLVRLAGKRHAGQITTIDLIILISLGVTLQNLTLLPGKTNSAAFIITVFVLHIAATRLAMHYPLFRRILRGQPRPLVKQGRVMHEALKEEGLTEEELMAALRKIGCASTDGIRLAVLEETGQISAIKEEAPT